jgi:hypothetical protein
LFDFRAKFIGSALSQRADIEAPRQHDGPVREISAELSGCNHAPPEISRAAEALASPSAIIEQLAEAVDARAAAARAERFAGFEPDHAHAIDQAAERETIRMDRIALARPSGIFASRRLPSRGSPLPLLGTIRTNLSNLLWNCLT